MYSSSTRCHLKKTTSVAVVFSPVGFRISFVNAKLPLADDVSSQIFKESPINNFVELIFSRQKKKPMVRIRKEDTAECTWRGCIFKVTKISGSL